MTEPASPMSRDLIVFIGLMLALVLVKTLREVL